MWINRDAIEIPRPASQRGGGIGENPRVASIVGAIKARFSVSSRGRGLGLRLESDQRIDAFAAGSNIHSYAAPSALRQAVAIETNPRFAGILRAVKTAAGSIGRSIGGPWRTPYMPCAGKQELRVGRADGQIGNAGIRA